MKAVFALGLLVTGASVFSDPEGYRQVVNEAEGRYLGQPKDETSATR